MTELVVTVEGSSSDVPILLHVRPAHGRSVERIVKGVPERIALEPGLATIEVRFPSGDTDTKTVVLEGEPIEVQFALPASEDGPMRLLDLTRASRRKMRRAEKSLALEVPSPRKPVVDPRARYRKDDVVGLSFAYLTRFSAPAALPLSVRVEQRGSQELVIDHDETLAHLRVLHLRDPRDVDVFDDLDSALAFLRVTHPKAPTKTRLTALPTPCSNTDGTHVALRAMEGDALPEVQVVPATPVLSALVAYLDLGDQRGISMLKGELAHVSKRAFQGKRRDPVSAAIGLSALLRLGPIEADLVPWSHNLREWFPALPDGGALRTAVLRQRPEATDAWWTELREAALGSVRVGVPLLADSVRCLRAALMDLEADERTCDAKVRDASSWVDRLSRVMDPDAVFTTLTLETKDLSMLWGVEGR